MHPPQAVGIERQQVVLDEAAILRPVLADDAEIVIVQPFGPVRGLSVPHVAAAPLHDHVVWDFQADQAVDDALTASVMLPIGVECHDRVAKESRRLRGRG
jgi:hypothetical protein